MKRSERLYRQARHHALIASATISCSVCMGVWAVRAWQSTALIGVIVLAFALTAFALAVSLIIETARLERIANNETMHEMRNSNRPRI